ncbi:MAG: type IV secretion system DNA-binding domain-containing protein [Candidatus Nomurabacteria bacterium]|jgi:hypothetical protein|nr:type IV secretion system DNA-binding domain-containing protein [Candidatus Nomurabacteria bacterium]
MLNTLMAFITTWYVWVPLVLILAYLTYRNFRKAKTIETFEWVLLALEIPRNNDKKELAAEQLFASLHGILRDKAELKMTGGVQEHISFEMASSHKMIRFYVRVPKHLQNFVEGQIYAQYPTVQIKRVDEDYTHSATSHSVVATVDLALTASEMLPIKTFNSFEVDPLAGITAALAKMDSSNEEVWVQVLARPIPDDWHKRATKYINGLKSGRSISVDLSGLAYFAEIISALWKPPESTAKSSIEISERDKTRVAEAEKKSQKLGYKVKIRLAYIGNDEGTARIQMQSIVGAFKQFNSTNLNGFKLSGKASFNRDDLNKYITRQFIDSGFILNIEELASVFHLPHTNVETPNIVWANTKTAEPPTKLPILTGDPEHDNQISAFGLTDFHGVKQQFGMFRSDRSRHVYIIGQTGTGKSGLLELFALSDVFHNTGYCIIDPHGDFAVNNIKFIPEHRIADVVYFNPADTAFPLGFNPMEVYDPSQRNNTSSEIIGVLKRMFDNSWGPRLEYILRYTLLALLEYPNSTLLDITRMLTDKKFRENVLRHVTDSVVLNFWRVEFAGWTERYIAEAVPPILNKVGAFVANPIIRNIIGQPKSTFNIRRIMDEGKILIVNLSKGLIGEDNAAILGSFLVTKIQLAAMSRSDIPRVEDRRPFYLYVDEFQNFATDSFAVILSEARKYGWNLTVANQSVSQMSETVRDAVFGNVGTIVSMRVSAEDSPLLAKQFEPQFEPNDLLNMNNRHFIVNMVIGGEKTQPFSATTLSLPQSEGGFMEQIVEQTRTHFARPRAEIESEIASDLMPPPSLLPKGAPNPRDARVQAATAAGVDPKILLKTSPGGVHGSQKLVIPGADTKQPTAEITVAPTATPKRKRVRSQRKPAEVNKSTK